MNFGCIKETPSIRNYDYDVVCGASNEKLPETYILPEDRLPKVGNQGSKGACLAFSIVAILEVMYRVEFGSTIDLSEGFFYGYNRKPNQMQTGMYTSTALDCCRKTGSVPISMFNVLEEMPEMYDLVKNRTDLAEWAKKTRIKGYSTITVPFRNIEKVKRALYDNKIPLLAVSNKYFGGCHAIIIVGWNEKGFVIQNSWGETWGDKGRGTVPHDAINYVYVLTDEVFEMKFTDVDKSKWYYDAVKETVFNGLMQGTGETTFEPEKPLTRAEMAQICVNLCKKIDEILDTQNK